MASSTTPDATDASAFAQSVDSVQSEQTPTESPSCTDDRASSTSTTTCPRILSDADDEVDSRFLDLRRLELPPAANHLKLHVVDENYVEGPADRFLGIPRELVVKRRPDPKEPVLQDMVNIPPDASDEVKELMEEANLQTRNQNLKVMTDNYASRYKRMIACAEWAWKNTELLDNMNNYEEGMKELEAMVRQLRSALLILPESQRSKFESQIQAKIGVSLEDILNLEPSA